MVPIQMQPLYSTYIVIDRNLVQDVTGDAVTSDLSIRNVLIILHLAELSICTKRRKYTEQLLMYFTRSQQKHIFFSCLRQSEGK
jgi:hypothetical protein